MKLDIHIYSLNIGTVQEMEDSLIYTRARGLSFGFGLFVYYNFITLLTQCDFFLQSSYMSYSSLLQRIYQLSQCCLYLSDW